MPVEIPIFPLDNVVLFPKVEVPLYIFEPRYRQMTTDALAGDGCIGMVVVQPQHQEEMGGDPPLFEIGCAGQIGRSERQADGTYQIVLQGSSRFRIEHELPRRGERLYRMARVELLGEAEPADGPGVDRDQILELLRAIAPDHARQFDKNEFAQLDEATFVNAFCQSLGFSTLEKQQLIEANSVRERADRLASLLEFRIAEQARGGVGSGSTIH